MVKCHNCGSSSYSHFMDTNCLGTNTPLTSVRCDECGLVFLNPRPDKELGKAYFDKAYSGVEGFENHSYYRDHDSILLRNNQRFEYIKKLDVADKSILDFGAGQGHFVKVAQENGWEVVGVEQSKEGIAAAKRLFNIDLKNSIENIKGRKFSVICLWDVIEHLEDPKAVLLMLAEYLHQDGYFIIETGNINSYSFYMDRKKWGYWSVDHFYYFSYSTLKDLLERIGFRIVHLNINDILKTKRSDKGWSKYLNPKYFIHPDYTLKIVWNRLKLQYYKLKYEHASSNELITMVAQS